HGSGTGRFVVDVDVHMSSPQAVPHRQTDARFKHFEAVRHAQVKIEEAVVNAAQVDSQRPAISLDARLREAGHRMNAGGCGSGLHPLAFGVGIATSSESANCNSYRRAY